MKKILVVILCLSFGFMLNAQEAEQEGSQKEAGLIFNNFESFGFTYRSGTGSSLTRLNAATLSGGNAKKTSDSTIISEKKTGFYLSIGKEFRKTLDEKWEFRYGADLQLNYTYYKSDYDSKRASGMDSQSMDVTFEPGINLVFGLNYVLNKNLVIGAEVLPYFRYVLGVRNVSGRRDQIQGYYFGISTQSVMLSVVYRF